MTLAPIIPDAEPDLHARISTTAIYAAACGPEEQAFAARFWRANDNAAPLQDGIAPKDHARQ
jgi:hypothetical protein